MAIHSAQTLERRARILEAARELIAEKPYSEITVRELARRCKVSVPTLYNQFGGKDALLGAAVESHFREALHGLVPDEEPHGPERILKLVARLAERTVVLAPYHQSVLRAFAEAARETESLQHSIASDLRKVFVRELEGLREAGDLAAWADPGILAIHLSTACLQGTAVWGQGLLGDEGLGAFMQNVIALLLLGAMVGDARTRLERAAEEAQTRLGGELAAAARRAATRSAAAR